MTINRRLEQLEESHVANARRGQTERMRRVIRALMTDADANAAAAQLAYLEISGGDPKELERARVAYHFHLRRLGVV